MAWYNSLSDLLGDVGTGIDDILGGGSDDPTAPDTPPLTTDPDTGNPVDPGQATTPNTNPGDTDPTDVGTTTEGDTPTSDLPTPGAPTPVGDGTSTLGGGAGGATTTPTSSSSGSSANPITSALQSIFGANSSPAQDALLAAEIAQQALNYEQQTSLQNQAITAATGSYNANAPLRALGVADLTGQPAPAGTSNTPAPDLSFLTANSPNPYAKDFQIGTNVPLGSTNTSGSTSTPLTSGGLIASATPVPGSAGNQTSTPSGTQFPITTPPEQAPGFVPSTNTPLNVTPAATPSAGGVQLLTPSQIAALPASTPTFSVAPSIGSSVPLAAAAPSAPTASVPGNPAIGQNVPLNLVGAPGTQGPLV